MALAVLRDVSVHFGGPAILEHVSISIEPGERSCVTGRNGEGKSTLLKVMAGLQELDSGERIMSPGIKIAYLEQDVPHDRPGTVRDILNLPIGVSEKFISQLGLSLDVEFNTLSGGMRRRVFLAAAVQADPDLLLLDEPTNHLDIESIEWLEAYLRRSRAACLFVTHDRTFLKHVATRVLDLDRGELTGWNCNYATFLKRKQDLIADEAVYWARKERKLKEEEAWIRRGVKARRTRNEGRVQALIELRREFAARRMALGTAKITIDTAAESGNQVIKAEGVTFGYVPEKPIIKNFSAKILRGERIGITGVNGAGKSTLLKLLTGNLVPNVGAVEWGSRVEKAYLDQLRKGLTEEKTVVENIAEDRNEVIVGGVRKHVYGYLGDFLFTPERARTPVKALSGGERARLLLAKRFMEPGNLLVLDEPTNDLDIETLELLEEQLASYTGTILLVSHDRTFLDNVVTSCFVLTGDGTVLTSVGGWEEASKTLANWRAKYHAPERPECANNKVVVPPVPKPATAKKLSYNETRELAALPQKIAALEAEIAALEAALADPSFFAKDPAIAAEKLARLEPAKAELESAETRWLELEERN